MSSQKPLADENNLTASRIVAPETRLRACVASV